MSTRRRRPKPPASAAEPAAPPPAQRPQMGQRVVGWLMAPVRGAVAHRRSIGWVMLSVVLLRLCFPPLALWPLGFVALVPWLWGLRRTTPWQAFWISWVFGFVHMLSVFTWLPALSRFNPFIYLGIPLLCLFQGFFYAVNGAGMIFFARRLAPWPAFAMAALWWAGWEWFRSVGELGAPYVLLGHTVRTLLPLAQVVSLGGVVLLSALVLLVNLSVMELVVLATKKFVDVQALARAAAAFGIAIMASIWGAAVMAHTRAQAEDEGIPLRVVVLQPNVGQMEKFASYAHPDLRIQRELQDKMTRDLFAMMERIEPGSADLIITPESAFTQHFFDLEIEADLQREIRERVRVLGAAFITGANDNAFHREDGTLSDDPQEARQTGESLDFDIFNGFYVFRPGDTELRRKADYRKIHLMPFGETVPYVSVIPGLQEKLVQIGSFLKGDKEQPPIFIDVKPSPEDPDGDIEQVHIGPTICFEDMFAGLHNRLARRGAQVFVNITNNAWYDPSLGSEYHYASARLRAPETRLPVILCTNSGVTAILDGTGRVTAHLPKLEAGILRATVHVPREPRLTLYARFGDWFGILGFFGSLLLMGVLIVRGRRAQG